jgi:hypothetical protein
MLFSSSMGRGLRNLVTRHLVRFCYQLLSRIFDIDIGEDRRIKMRDSGLTNTNSTVSTPPIPLPIAHLGNIKPQTA